MNVVTLCQDQGKSSMSVYYPNKKLNSPSTTCFQTGISTVSENKINFDLKLGSCKNGRDAEAVKFQCEVAGSETGSEMTCIDLNQNRKLVLSKKEV